MTIAESRRLALFESAKTSWGEDTAQTLMDLLPPDPDALATKADLRTVIAELRSEMHQLIGEQTRLLMITMLGTTVTIILAIVFASPR
ncbi:MAG: hypothetical protein ACTHN0_01720 [Aquihabitans sp.]